MLLPYWTSRFRSMGIRVNLEPSITANHRVNPRINSNQLTINVNLFDLIVKTGTINTWLPYSPSQRDAFDSKKQILANIRTDTRNLSIIEIQNPETKRDISHNVGVGIAALTVDELFGIDWSTVTYVTGVNGRRPDIVCYDRDGRRKIVFEAKGTTSRSTRISQLNHAVNNQKNTIPANINIAIGTYLTTDPTNDYSDVMVRDPPPEYAGNNENEEDKAILKALHYSRAFNYIDQYGLSRYFYLMRNRIKKGRFFPDLGEKLTLFRKLKSEYKRVLVRNRKCVGRIQKVKEPSAFVFKGILEDLLKINGIFEFMGVEKIEPIRDEHRYLKLYPDGVCIGIFDSLKAFDDFYLKEKPYWE